MSERRSELNITAQPFRPKEVSRTPLRIQTARPPDQPAGKWVCLDAVPFTPSQGVVTPSPTNVAAQRFYQRYCGPWPHPLSPAHYAGVYQHGGTPGLVDSRVALDSVGSESDASAASGYSPAVSPAVSPCIAGGQLVFRTPFFWQRVVSPETMDAVAHYGPPVTMQPCYLGADGSLSVGPLHPYAGPFAYRQVFQHQHQYQALNTCGTPLATAVTPRAGHGFCQPCLTPVRVPDCSLGAAPSVSGSDRSPRASGPVLTGIAEVLVRAAALADPLPAEVVQLAQLVQAYGLEHLEPGLDALHDRCPPDSQSAKPAGSTARLNARQRRTLRRAFERAKSALDSYGVERVAARDEAVTDGSDVDLTDDQTVVGGT